MQVLRHQTGYVEKNESSSRTFEEWGDRDYPRGYEARLVPEHLGWAQSKLLGTRLEPSFIHGAPEALQHMQARAPHHAATCSLVQAPS